MTFTLVKYDSRFKMEGGFPKLYSHRTRSSYSLLLCSLRDVGGLDHWEPLAFLVFPFIYFSCLLHSLHLFSCSLFPLYLYGSMVSVGACLLASSVLTIF